jgi:hypothetical protein
VKIDPASTLRVLAAVAAFNVVAGGCGGAVDVRPPQWSFISATITEPSCATVNCHSAVSQRAGLDLHAREIGYYSLVNGVYVIPDAPAQSSLIDWLTTSGPLRMPPDSPLPPDDIQLIEHWISDGALND